MSFDWFSVVFHCSSRRFSSLLWELSSVWHLSSKNLLSFSGSLKLRFTFTRKTQKVFWFEMPNSHCFAMKLNSHSALLNLLDSQCKTRENHSKLIAHRAVHFSLSCKRVPFLFFHGKVSFRQLNGNFSFWFNSTYPCTANLMGLPRNYRTRQTFRIFILTATQNGLLGQTRAASWSILGCILKVERGIHRAKPKWRTDFSMIDFSACGWWIELKFWI